MKIRNENPAPYQANDFAVIFWLGREYCSHLSLAQIPANREFFREIMLLIA